MKTLIKISGLFLIAIYSISLSAQTKDLTIKDLEMPNAPALTLLDQTTTNIETPKNIQALTTTLISSFSANNIGFEINPYMLLKENKSYYDYYNVKRIVIKDANGNDITTFKHKGWFPSMYKDLSISFAKVKGDSTSSFSIGARTNLIRIVGNEKAFIEKFTRIEKAFARITNSASKDDIEDYKYLKNVELSSNAFNKILIQLTEADFALINDEFTKDGNNTETLNFCNINNITLAEIDAVKNRRNGIETIWQIVLRYREYKKITELYNTSIQDYYKREDAFRKEFATNLKLNIDNIAKPLFTLDAAVAYSHIYKGNTYSDGQMGKFGAWSTLNLNVKLQDDNKFYFSAYGYGRYLKDNAYLDKTTNQYMNTEYFDIGFKGELEYYKISAAYEYIHRTKEANNYRSVGSIKYKYNDTITLNGGFGKNFEQTNNLVSFLGISWGIESGNKFEGENR